MGDKRTPRAEVKRKKEKRQKKKKNTQRSHRRITFIRSHATRCTRDRRSITPSRQHARLRHKFPSSQLRYILNSFGTAVTPVLGTTDSELRVNSSRVRFRKRGVLLIARGLAHPSPKSSPPLHAIATESIRYRKTKKSNRYVRFRYSMQYISCFLVLYKIPLSTKICAGCTLSQFLEPQSRFGDKRLGIRVDSSPKRECVLPGQITWN